MRTTINIPDELSARLKRRAAERRTTLTALIEEAVRQSLAPRRPAGKPARVRLTTFGRDGLLPGVDLDDSAALADLLEPPVETTRR